MHKSAVAFTPITRVTLSCIASSVRRAVYERGGKEKGGNEREGKLNGSKKEWHAERGGVS